MSLIVSSCGPGQFLGPTITASPTSTPTPTITPSPTPTLTPTITPTPTPTPIPGFEAPLVIDGIGVQIHSAVGHADPPPRYRLTSGYNTLLNIEIAFSGEGTTDDLLEVLYLNPETENPFRNLLNGMAVIDEKGNESLAGLFSATGELGVLILSFAVKKEATNFSLRLSDEQVLDLAPVLEFGTNWVEGSVFFDGAPLPNAMVALILEEKIIQTTQTDVDGKFLFTNAPPNIYPDDYEVKITLEGENTKCVVSHFLGDVKTGWRYSHDFKLDKSIYMVEKFSVLDSGEFATCGDQ
jgi:hypothetical protein